MRAWIGTSGWTYSSWDGPVYPANVPKARKLEFYASHLFDTVELNASFYHWPRETSFASWSRRLPANFQMTVKAPRGLTHGSRLNAPETWIARMQPGLSLLADRLGVLLLQLPPDMRRDDARLGHFLATLPPWVRVAVEFRHESWLDDKVFQLLEDHRAAYVVMSGAHLPCVLRATSDFVYVRLHGPDDEHLYGGSYSDDSMQWWADRVQEWLAQSRSVFAYFNNDWDGHAVFNAQALRSRVAATSPSVSAAPGPNGQ